MLERVCSWLGRRRLKTIAFIGVVGMARAFLARRKRAVHRFDRQFTGPYPRRSGAISAVTGGPPEDMNAMPAVSEASGAAIHDGSTLSRGPRP